MGKRERKKGGECRRARREEVGRKEKTNEAIFGRKENKNMEVEYAEKKKKNRRIEERRKEKSVRLCE